MLNTNKKAQNNRGIKVNKWLVSSVQVAESLVGLLLSDSSSLTCVQQQPHHTEVGVGDAVVESRVAVAVGHVDHVFQQHRRHLRKRHQVVGHPRGLSHLGAGDAEPLELHSVGAGELRVRAEVMLL